MFTPTIMNGLLRLTTLFVCLLSVLHGNAQSCRFSLSIVLKEKHNLKALESVKVICRDTRAKNSEWQTYTDENGTCLFTDLCDANYLIRIETDEYDPTSIVVNPREQPSLTLKLAHNHHSLHTVTVSGTQSARLLAPKETRSADANNECLGADISTQLGMLSGVQTLSNGANIAKPVIHGLHSNRILMLNNGIRQEDQQWGTEHAPNMDAYNQTLTVLKGAAGVRYGTDAIGGVVLSNPLPLRGEAGWGGNIALGAGSNSRMGSIGLMLEHRMKRHPEFAFRVQSSARQNGNYRLADARYVANSGLQELNYSGTAQYRGLHTIAEVYYSHFGNTTGIYRGTHTGSRADLMNAIASDTPLIYSGFSYALERPRQVVSHDLLKLKLEQETKRGMLRFTYSVQRNYRREYDVIRVENGKAQLNLRLNTQAINIHWERKDAPYLRGETGIEGQYQHNFFADGDRVFIPSYYGYSASAYTLEHYEKGRWHLEGGLRIDYRHFEMYNPQGPTLQNVRYRFDYKNPSLSLAGNYRVTNDLNLLLTLSSAWRAPQASELFSAGLHQGAARIEWGNRNLLPEQAYNSSLNLSWKKGIWNLEAEAYAQRIQHFIFLSPGGQLLTIRGYYNVFQYLQTNAFLRGADMNVSCKPDTHWQFEVKASLLRARDITRNDWLVLMPSDRLRASVRYARTCLGLPCFVSVNGQWVARQSRLPRDFDALDFLPPPQAYFVLGAELGADLTLKKQKLVVSLSGYNLLNAAYRDYMDVFRYFLNRPGRNISLHLRIPFS